MTAKPPNRTPATATDRSVTRREPDRLADVGVDDIARELADDEAPEHPQQVLSTAHG
jgi:hypothetical protein